MIRGEQAADMAKFAKAEQMKTTYGLRAIRRHTADGWHYFIVNLTPKDIAGDVTLAVPFESATWFNPMNGDIQPAEVHNGQLHIALKSGESRILQTSNQPSTNIATTASGTEEITLQGPWVLSFTDESPRVEGTFKLNKLQTWETLSDSAAVTMGTGVYTTSIKLSAQQAKQHWQIDLGDVRESARGPAELVLPRPDTENADSRPDAAGLQSAAKNTTYADWKPVPSGLNTTVKLVR